MRMTSLLPLIALLGLGACDSAKLAELTGVKPSAAACASNALPACAPGRGAAPPTMAPEAEKDTLAPAVQQTAYARDTVRRTPSRSTHRVTHLRRAETRQVSTYVMADTQPQRVYDQPPRQDIYVNQEIDRTASVYGRQVYNTYARPVVYNGLYREAQQGNSGVRQGGYAYHYGNQGPYVDCPCDPPAAGRDRAGYLTWPGKTEPGRY